ncbi:YbfB/YjiJ family MFS transporter [Nitratireductor sp. XY-223]|uniref:YbfB/YjiJ family MFS transporter n=1 Tax=Nitratireductor sp. XY-223 TaxID=2561926 RepID=UPI00145C0236|nr:YbfB/YjiJ family MFS transporter [Nitratireductor sp. XY-223]
MTHSTVRIIAIGMASLAIAMGIGRFAFTPLLPMMQADGLVDISGGGVLASVHFVGYLAGAAGAAYLPVPPKTTLRLSLIFIALCTLATGFTDNFILWSVLRFLCGVLSAFTLVLVSNFYVKHLAAAGRAQGQGWVFSGVGAGIALAGLGALALMAAGIGSADGWILFGAVSLVAAVAVSANVGAEVAKAPVSPGKAAERRSPIDWVAVVAYGAAGMGYIIPATYLPVMAREIVSSPFLFGLAWPVFGLAAFFSTLLAARLQARFSNRQIWAAGQFVMAAGLLVPVLLPDLVTIMIAGICVGGTFMIITMMGMKEAHRIAHADDVMRHIGVLTVAFAGGQMIGPVFAGAIHAVTGSFSSSLVLASVALVATGAALVRRHAGRKAVHP